MFIPSFLQPQNTTVVETLIQNIESLIRHGKVPLTLDEKLTTAAREVFEENLRKNQLVSKVSNLIGIIGATGFTGSMVTILSPFMQGTIGSAIETYQEVGFEYFNSLVANISPIMIVAAAVSCVVLKIFLMTRNREGYQLQKALDAKTGADMIRQLSLGANIHQRVAEFNQNAALANDIFFHECRTVKLPFLLTSSDKKEALAYLLIMSKNSKQLASHYLSLSTPETAQFFINFGADMNDALEWASKAHKLELLKTLVANKVKLDVNFKGKTPLELLIPLSLKDYNDKPITKESVEKIFECLSVAPSVYTQKSAEDLCKQLNKIGVAVRLEYAKVIHQCFNRTN